ncbi:MAG: baseplate J/gp47 family protein [Clostridia bacterium]|nr:baseplate J/gp47 family protein [Clostridia bacterium]
MYENLTFETILQRILDRISGVDKREGSVVYDVSAPTAIEFQNAYINLEGVLTEAYADTASKEYLIKRCGERGIGIQPATHAVRQGEFNIDVPIGTWFSLNELNYIVEEKIDTGVYKMLCDTAGVVGNAETGSLIPHDYIDGLETAVLTDVLIPGEDEEDVEHLRQRYFNSFDSQAFGGNVADYKEKINAIDGVGGVKIYRAWNGGGTVKAVIIDSTYSKPSTILVDEVQTIIDPTENQGEGLGLAPIGHIVTIAGCGEISVNIQTSIVFQDEWTWETIEPYVNTAIDDYFKELAEEWEEADKNDLIVRISQIETRLLDLEGVLDISDTLLNGVATNLSIDKDSIPIRGTVTNV